jgi:hypothetical protein
MPLIVTLPNNVQYEISGTGSAVPLTPPPPDPPPPPPGGVPPENGAEITPTLTANADGGFIASASSEYVESGIVAAAFKAFNKVASSGWAYGWSSTAEATPSAPQWLALQFPVPKACYKYHVRIRADTATLAPRAWTFEGYDGSSWVALHAVSGLSWSNGENKIFSVAAPGVYGAYRLRITASDPIYCQIDEFRMFS